VTSGETDLPVGARPGDLIAGKYRVERVLGTGGMGVVVAAVHEQIGSRVAIKFLLPHAVVLGEATARFTREARATVQIKSEHIARVLDAGTLESGAPFIVMEFLEGRDLARWLGEDGPLAIDQAVEFILHACEALAEVHALGMVHRDLKPANLFVVKGADGLDSVKVLDFGISKGTASLGDADMTKTAALLGTPRYMAPEQLRSTRDVDARADLWALGVVLYELLAGRHPFAAETLPELIIQVATERPSPLREVRHDVPPELVAVIERCLEKAILSRYAHVGELAAALAPFASPRAQASVERVTRVLQRAGFAAPRVPSAPPAPMPLTQTDWSRVDAVTPPLAVKRTPHVALIAAVVIAALLGVAGFVGWSRQKPPATQASASAGLPPPPVAPIPLPASAALPAMPTLVPLTTASAPVPPTAEASSAGPPVPTPPPRHPPKPAPTARPPSAPNCDPPFIVDAEGIKRPKPECL
jgi:eukaryotic-like serine/threonine-protein kinase